MIVIDSSFVIAALLAEERSGFVHEVLNEVAETPLIAPPLILWEMANVLQKKVVRQALDPSDRADIWGRFNLLGLSIQAVPQADDLVRLGELGDRHGLTAYDAAFLDLALSEGAALATLDQDLAMAASSEGLTVLSPYAA